jgi:hypothetical protein
VQHPLQDVESHRQAADAQCSPEAQLAVAPQVHAPPEHVRPLCVQSEHAVPPVPHVLSPGVWQSPVDVQHPLGHDVTLHTQTPLWQT